MIVFRRPYTEPGIVGALARVLMDELSRDCNPYTHVPALLLVGNGLVIGDAIGPMVGDELRRRRFSGIYAGTTKQPVLLHTVDQMQALLVYRAARVHRKPYVVAADAAVGFPNTVTVHRGGFQIGSGVAPERRFGWKPQAVGNITVACGTVDHGQRLEMADATDIRGMVEVVTAALLSVWQQWDEHTMREFELAAAAGQDD